MADSYRYEKYTEDNEIKSCPIDDKDGSVTGKIVLNVPRYFDENPEERKRLGWIKHIVPDRSAIEYNHHTQFLVKSIRQIDPYTVTDEYRVMEKSEEQLAFEEMLAVAEADWETVGGADGIGGIRFFG